MIYSFIFLCPTVSYGAMSQDYDTTAVEKSQYVIITMLYVGSMLFL